IAQVWQAVLRVDKVGMNDNFFDLGGHSLLLVEVLHQLRDRLGLNLTMVDLFTYPTISALSQHLTRAREPGPSEPHVAAPPAARSESRRQRRSLRQAQRTTNTPEEDRDE